MFARANTPDTLGRRWEERSLDSAEAREWSIDLFVLAEIIHDEDLPARIGDFRDDLMVGATRGDLEPYGELAFSRIGSDPEQALREVIGALTTAYGADAVLGVDPDLVDISWIAGQFGITREAVRHWADGTRGPGWFPQRLGVVGKGQRVWRWSDVLAWARRHGMGDVEGDHPIPTHIALKVDAEIQARRAANAESAAA